MGSNFLIAVVFGIGVGAWVYSKIQRRTGGNTQNSLIVAGMASVGGVVLFLTLLSILFH